MGFFSWITQDTNRSIPSSYSDRPTFPVTMTDDKGNKWTEDNYEGYGEFVGKDYYQLIAEMNRPEECTGDVDNDRLIGITLSMGISAIENKKTGKIFKGGGNDFFNWNDKIFEGKSANELLEDKDWKHIDIIDKNVKHPNLTEDEDWIWEDAKPEDCPEQGFFYEGI